MQLIVEGIDFLASLLTWLWNIIKSSEGISTLLVILIMLLKLYINNEATLLQKKSLAVSIPSELTVLIVGFLISSAVSDNSSTDYFAVFVLIIISLILLVGLYAAERSLENHLSGKWDKKVWTKVFLMYLFGCGWYLFVVFGGVV